MSDQTRNWSLLTNHAHVLVCLLCDRDSTLPRIAAQVGISRRAAGNWLGLQCTPALASKLVFPFTDRRFAHAQFPGDGGLGPLAASKHLCTNLAAFSHLHAR